MRILEKLELGAAAGLYAIGFTNKYVTPNPEDSGQVNKCVEKTFRNIYSYMPTERTGLSDVFAVRPNGEKLDIGTLSRHHALTSTSIKFTSYLNAKFGYYYFDEIKDGLDAETSADLHKICKNELEEKAKYTEEFANQCLIAATVIISLIVVPRIFLFVKDKALDLSQTISTLLDPSKLSEKPAKKKRPTMPHQEIGTLQEPVSNMPELKVATPMLPTTTVVAKTPEERLQEEWGKRKRDVVNGNVGKRVTKLK